MIHPVNSFIACRSCDLSDTLPERPGAFSLLYPGTSFIADSGGPWAGSRRVCFKSGAANPVRPADLLG
jgi:hypothetical protein